MYTPEEIRSIEFTKARGYKASEVDPFIDKCADTVEALIKENQDLKKKLEVLADKLVEYRNDEDSLRTALLSAQRLGDTIVREANHKAGLILEDANIKAEKIADNARRSIQEQEVELKRVKQEVKEFKGRLLAIYKEHLSLIDVLPEGDGVPAVPEESVLPEEPVAAAPVAEQPEEPAVVPTEAPVPVPEEATPSVPEDAPVAAEAPAAPAFSLNIPQLEEDVEVTEVSPKEVPAATPSAPASNPRFSGLKFGAEYDISEDDEEDPGFFKRKK